MLENNLIADAGRRDVGHWGGWGHFVERCADDRDDSLGLHIVASEQLAEASFFYVARQFLQHSTQESGHEFGCKLLAGVSMQIFDHVVRACLNLLDRALQLRV